MPHSRRHSGSAKASERRRRRRELSLAICLGILASLIMGGMLFLLYTQSRG